MDDKNLDLLHANKLILVRTFVVMVAISTFIYQIKYMDKFEDMSDTTSIIILVYWALWIVLVIFIAESIRRKNPQLVYI